MTESAQPCGCDLGCQPIPHYCEQHRPVAQYHSDAGRVGWVGVDLDGLLVEWDPKYLPDLGPPIEAGLELVRRLKAEGVEVRIFTARVQPSPDEPAWIEEAARLGFDSPESWVAGQVARIDDFCLHHFGAPFRITASKDWRMITCYDDRCVQMIPNTGESLQAAFERKMDKLAADITEALNFTFEAQ